MTKQNNIIDDKALDDLLNGIEVPEVPTHFSHNVMQAIDTLPEEAIVTTPSWWQWLALIGGGIPALIQLAAFIFSAWNIVSVG